MEHTTANQRGSPAGGGDRGPTHHLPPPQGRRPSGPLGGGQGSTVPHPGSPPCHSEPGCAGTTLPLCTCILHACCLPPGGTVPREAGKWPCQGSCRAARNPGPTQAHTHAHTTTHVCAAHTSSVHTHTNAGKAHTLKCVHVCAHTCPCAHTHTRAQFTRAHTQTHTHSCTCI